MVVHVKDLDGHDIETYSGEARVGGGPGRRRARKPPLRKKIVAKIPSNRRVTRGVAHIAFGTVAGLGKTMKWTAIGGKRAFVAAGRHARRETLRTLYGKEGRPDDWSRPFRRVDRQKCMCGFVSDDSQDYTEHVMSHRWEPGQWRAQKPTIRLSTVRRTAGKTVVRPADWAPTGRHRKRVAGRSKDDTKRAKDLIKKYRPHLDKIGEMQMSSDNEASRIHKAFEAFADQPRAKRLTDLRAQVAGLERALLYSADEVFSYGRRLKRAREDGGSNIAPELVDPFVRGMQEGVNQMVRASTLFIAMFEDHYAEQIRLAREEANKKKKTEPPAIDLAG